MKALLTVHQSLKLPARYRVLRSVEGPIKVGQYYHDQKLVALRHLVTDTHGQDAAFAMRIVNADSQWKEIDGTEFNRLAGAILNGNQIEI